MSWLRRLSNTFRPHRVYADIDRELSFHIAERADQLRADGLSDEEAVRRARIQFGNPIVQRERARDMNIAAWATASYEASVTPSAAGSHTCFHGNGGAHAGPGIGANTAVFSAIDGVLLRSLPFPEVISLFGSRDPGGSWGNGHRTGAACGLEPFELDLPAISGYSTTDVVETRGELLKGSGGRLSLLAFSKFCERAGDGSRLRRRRVSADGPHVLLLSNRLLALARRRPARARAAGATEGLSISTVGVMPSAFSFPSVTSTSGVPTTSTLPGHSREGSPGRPESAASGRA